MANGKSNELEALRQQVALLNEENQALQIELRHRVGNNLQIVSSLIDLSSKGIGDPQVIQALAEVRAKIHAIGLVQPQLFGNLLGDQVDMERFVENQVEHLGQIYYRKNVVTELDCEAVSLMPDQAIPLALVLNELIANAFKHPFQSRHTGRIQISLQQDENGLVRARVKDNGAGLPENMDIYQTDTLGLKLVRNIVLKQLQGKFKLRRQRGSSFVVEFQRKDVTPLEEA